MKAFRLSGWGTPPAIVETDQPIPRDGEVLVRVDAAGLCHSDLHVIDAAQGALPFQVPFTLGHEIAGRVAAVGPAAAGVAVGERVVVYGPWGCGHCSRCAVGRENYCDRRSELAWAGAGLGRDGGMAEYVLVPATRHPQSIGDLDPTQAAPLTDAGLTPYHAIQPYRARLGDDSTVAVIGIGGLGHLAIQILRALTTSRVFAVDVREDALALADRSGAHLSTRTGPDTGQVLRTASAGRGVDVVLDFVASAATLALATGCLRSDGDLAIVGSGGGHLTVGKPSPLPQGCRVALPFWGSRTELAEVIGLARAATLRVEVARFPLSATPEAITLLRHGQLNGRAVLVPD